jgi:hypothetical protein
MAYRVEQRWVVIDEETGRSPPVNDTQPSFFDTEEATRKWLAWYEEQARRRPSKSIGSSHKHDAYAAVAALAKLKAPLEAYHRFTYECWGCGADFNGADWGPPPKQCPNCVGAGQVDPVAMWKIYEVIAPRRLPF